MNQPIPNLRMLMISEIMRIEEESMPNVSSRLKKEISASLKTRLTRYTDEALVEELIYTARQLGHMEEKRKERH
jgi:hypothetical protein